MASNKIYRSLAILLASTLILSGCQTGNNVSPEEKYRDSFTEEEKKTGTAAFPLMKNIKVDARITPAGKYEKGLKKYYMKNYRETNGKKGKKEFMRSPWLYGRKLSEIQNLIAAETKTAFTGKAETDPSNLTITQKMKNKDGSRYTFFSNWDGAGEWPDDGGSISCPHMYCESDGIDHSEAIQTANAVMWYVQDFEKAETPFIPDRDAEAERLKAFMEKLLGRKLCDQWECAAVTKEIIGEVNRTLGYTTESESYYQPPEKDYCVYIFYTDVDGLPFRDTCLSYHLKEGETASQMTRMGAASDLSDTLAGLGQRAQTAIVSEEGLISIDTSNTRFPGGVYKGRQKVMAPDKILAKVRDYYEHELVISPITVTGLSLVYMGYFTDGSEGEIQATIAPFWTVDTKNDTDTDSRGFIFDAFTGESIELGG